MPTLSAPLVGMRFRPPALTILQGLGMDQPLRLRREPENEYDENAIAVHLPEGWESVDPDLAKEAEAEATAAGGSLPASPQLGYIARSIATDWAPILDGLSKEDWPEAKLTFGERGDPRVSLEVEEK